MYNNEFQAKENNILAKDEIEPQHLNMCFFYIYHKYFTPTSKLGEI